MKYENEENLRLLQLQFIGKILAGFTHEIKNYLAIIKESNGLIEDLITLGKTSQVDSEQYLEITRSIEEYIEKTNNLFRYLNRFAHRMDSQLATFNLNETLEELIALVTRFANQKKISIGKDFQEDIPPIHSNPSLVQFVAFSFLHEKIKNLDNNSKITIQTAAAENTVKLRIIPEGNFLEGNDDSPSITFENLEKIIKQLGGNIVQEKGKETLITLAINPS